MYRHYFIEQLQPGKRPVGVGQQLVEQAELLGGQGLHLVPAADGVGVVIQHDVPRRDLPFVHNACAAQMAQNSRFVLAPSSATKILNIEGLPPGRSVCFYCTTAGAFALALLKNSLRFF